MSRQNITTVCSLCLGNDIYVYIYVYIFICIIIQKFIFYDFDFFLGSSSCDRCCQCWFLCFSGQTQTRHFNVLLQFPFHLSYCFGFITLLKQDLLVCKEVRQQLTTQPFTTLNVIMSGKQPYIQRGTMKGVTEGVKEGDNEKDRHTRYKYDNIITSSCVSLLNMLL